MKFYDSGSKSDISYGKFTPEILTEVYIGHPYLITALFEIRPVAYFGPKQDTFDQQTLLFLLQYGVTF